MPSSRIIRVASVEDIDLTKVSVYDLNNRYVDSQGNMYGLKYNRSDKKIEVIKMLGMVRGTPEFGEQPEVINGCSDLFVAVPELVKALG